MDLAQAKTELAEVDNAIRKARRLASYSTGDLSATRQSLADLHVERDRLQRTINELEAIELGVANPTIKVVELPPP